MKLPKDLSGASLIRHLCKRWDYELVHQVGSHVILQTGNPSHQRLPVPDHHVLRIGTLNSIIRLVSKHKHVTKEEVLRGL